MWVILYSVYQFVKALVKMRMSYIMDFYYHLLMQVSVWWDVDYFVYSTVLLGFIVLFCFSLSCIYFSYFMDL